MSSSQGCASLADIHRELSFGGSEVAVCRDANHINGNKGVPEDSVWLPVSLGVGYLDRCARYVALLLLVLTF